MLADPGARGPTLRLCWPHLGAMLAHLGGYVGPSWGYVGPSWGICWPILKLCWLILSPMLAHVDPSGATCAISVQKMLNGPKNTVNYRGFCRHAHPTRGRRQGRQPLSPTERERNAFGYATARGPLAGLKGYAHCRRPLHTGGSSQSKSSVVGWSRRAKTQWQ